MGPLEGIKVLDLTAMVSGPVATMILADQGAEVIKVEPPGGEQMRYMGLPHNGVPATFFSCNRGKKSIVIDLKTDAGKNVLKDLILGTDILVQNFRPGAMSRMGFGEEAVRKLNKKIIYVSISGFGEQGPYAHKRVYDPVIQALSGATDIQANRETGKPAMFRIIIADKVTSITAAQAISSALFHRERKGEGQHIKLSMLETMLAFFWPEGMGGLTYAEREFDVTKEQGTMDLIFETQDGFITAGAVSGKEWVGMCQALNRAELIEDERFATSSARMENADLRKQIVADEVKHWHSAEILKRLDDNDVPSAPLLSRMELMSHEQINANKSIERTVYEGFGEVRQAVPAARFDVTPSMINGPAPKLGEHSREVLLELGYHQRKCDELLKSEVVIAD
ncbi:MAG: crotonobetainyl-CoA:carnitine CoA-transferase CaiB-like acyl-CoA transferase [Candidatus Azotimanducaceae bacterium]|jgi:crotonobetainyl-CoA:carnitine CoA-transferase CaiB-like acyl-CoA transferase